MKTLTPPLTFLLILCIFTCTQSAPLFLGKYAKKPNNSSYKYETQYFTQRLDHFSFQDSGSFSQRYLINKENWVGAQRRGPIFLYCGNEGDIEWFAYNSGFLWELAPRFGAMLLFPEHRYYGESMPYGSKEEAYKNNLTLSYLTAEQAIADYAVLLRELKRNLSAESCPVVLFGGSYGGMLAAWMRLKYPHLTIGALASSAPILQFEDIVPPETFYDIVSNDFRRESTSCFNIIKESWDTLQSIGNNADGLNQLTKTFHLCGELKTTQDLSDWLSSAYSYLAMVNYPYPSDFLMPLPGHPIREVYRHVHSTVFATVFGFHEILYKKLELRIKEQPSSSYSDGGSSKYVQTYAISSLISQDKIVKHPFLREFLQYVCRRIDNAADGTSVLDRIFYGVSVYYNYSGAVDCFKLDDDPHGMSGWQWQACTEMVMPMSSDPDKSMFPSFSFNYTYDQERCMKSYGVKPRGRWITTEFGGRDFKTTWKKSGSNIIFANGLLDPWSGGSVLQNVSDSLIALNTKEGAHHLDLRASTPNDPDWLVQQRKSEIRLIEGWIHDYNQGRGSASSM